MTFMPWSSDLMLGIPLIDAQHQRLVELVNALHAALQQPSPDRLQIASILEGLVDYTHNHFIVEEVQFQQHGYPQTEAHIHEHARFTALAMEWLVGFEDGHAVDPQALQFLKDWLVHHICEEDRAYVPFMRAALAGDAAAATDTLPSSI